MLTLDTSALLAALNGRDPHHSEAVQALRADRGPFVIPTGLMSEATYMIEARLGSLVLDAFFADIQDGAFMMDCGENDLARIRALMSRYGNLPLGYADASVIACAERRAGRVLSYDLGHFLVVAGEGMIRVIGFE